MNKICPSILNIAAGKILPIELSIYKRFFLVNLDPMYYEYDTPEEIERCWTDRRPTKETTLYCNADAYEFMERTKIIFDKVCIYRFLEHVSMDKVLYFIYLVSTVTEVGAEVDVIVPNYTFLASMILHEDVNSVFFEKDNVLLTTELLNEPSCPHASIWTEARAKYSWYKIGYTMSEIYRMLQYHNV